jgi:heptaprenyl diphosphate synthase
MEVGNDILKWAEDYLMTANNNIKRPQGGQVVCPFVKPSIRNDSFYLSFRPEVDGQSSSQVEEIMIEAMTSFQSLEPSDKASSMKKALIVVFHNIRENHTSVLDVVHERLKDKFVENGLMLGQFHQHCDERCIHNPGFPVAISPHPLIAVRNMAIHDILFLGDNANWFKAYDLRFGQRFSEPEKIAGADKHLFVRYSAAKDKWMPSA